MTICRKVINAYFAFRYMRSHTHTHVRTPNVQITNYCRVEQGTDFVSALKGARLCESVQLKLFTSPRSFDWLIDTLWSEHLKERVLKWALGQAGNEYWSFVYFLYILYFISKFLWIDFALVFVFLKLFNSILIIVDLTLYSLLFCFCQTIKLTIDYKFGVCILKFIWNLCNWFWIL